MPIRWQRVSRVWKSHSGPHWVRTKNSCRRKVWKQRQVHEEPKPEMKKVLCEKRPAVELSFGAPPAMRETKNSKIQPEPIKTGMREAMNLKV